MADNGRASVRMGEAPYQEENMIYLETMKFDMMDYGLGPVYARIGNADDARRIIGELTRAIAGLDE